MLQSVLDLLPDTSPSLLGPSFHSGIWFYLLVFVVILLGAVFIITPVPENSLLFLAGAMAVNNQVSLVWVLVASIAGAYVGYDLNYWSGRLLDLAVCRRFCPHILQAKNMEKTRALVERFGPLSVVISRFIPAVNLPPFFAGLDSMNYSRYVVANILGAALWCSVTVLLGYFVGSFEVIQDYVTFVFDPVLLVTAITIIYAVVKLVRAREKNGKTPA
ncbi:MAG: DedA family protein [Methanomicrobiales archaeon]|nr:DedA family protein [Methanomicrobiales archaeon]